MRPPASKHLGAPGSHLRSPSVQSCFVAQPSNLTVLWWTATLHRLWSMTSSCFSRRHAARTWSRWPPGPSSQAYLSLHSSEAPQGIDLSRPLFTCTNTNQASTFTYNTRPRVNPHHVVNHSTQPGATIHQASDALVLTFETRYTQSRGESPWDVMYRTHGGASKT
jgi:hypothetical protein